ncbi:hypothetical protein IJJ97_06615 [bacterium]|nr:hypothetical protein [bacterium]
MSLKLKQSYSDVIIREMPYFDKISQSEIKFPNDFQFAKNENQLQFRSSKGGKDFFKYGFTEKLGIDVFVLKDEIEIRQVSGKNDSIVITKEQIKDIHVERTVVSTNNADYLYYIVVLVLNHPISLKSIGETREIFDLFGFNFKSIYQARFVVQEIKDMLQINNVSKNGRFKVNFINFNSVTENESSLILKKDPYWGYSLYCLGTMLLVILYLLIDERTPSSSSLFWIIIFGIGILTSVIALFFGLGFSLSLTKNQAQFYKILPWGSTVQPKNINLRDSAKVKATEMDIKYRIDNGNDIGWFEVRIFSDFASKESEVLINRISFEEAEYIAYAINRIINGEPMDTKYDKVVHKKKSSFGF